MTKWRKHGNGIGATLTLNAGVTAEVSYEASERLPYDAPHYNVRVLGERLPGRSKEFDEAKMRAESAMRAALQMALDQLDNIEAEQDR